MIKVGVRKYNFFLQYGMLNGKPTIVCVIGSTGTGKSAFALELAKVLNGEIINADAMQVCHFYLIFTCSSIPSAMMAYQ